MKKKLVAVIIVLLIVFGGIYVWHWFVGLQIKKYFANMKPPAATVNVSEAKTAIWHNLLITVGSASAEQGVDISAEVPGKVTQIYFKSGDEVHEGDPILQLNGEVLTAQLESNQAQLLLTKTNLDREQALYAQKVAPQSDLDQANAEYQQALAEVAKTQAQLRQVQITAPFSGKLGLRQVDLGEYLTAGQTIVNLQSKDLMRVDFSIAQNALAPLQVGLPITVSTLSYPDKVFTGKVVAVNSQVDAQNRSLQVRADVENPDGLLKPGMFVSIQVILPSTVSVVTIPQIAVVYNSVGNYIFTIHDNKAVKTYVTLGERRDDQVGVVKGLMGGESVVYAGQVKLRDGMDVVVEKPEAV